MVAALLPPVDVSAVGSVFTAEVSEERPTDVVEESARGSEVWPLVASTCAVDVAGGGPELTASDELSVEDSTVLASESSCVSTPESSLPASTSGNWQVAVSKHVYWAQPATPLTARSTQLPRILVISNPYAERVPHLPCPWI